MLKKYFKWLAFTSLAVGMTALTCSCDDNKEPSPDSDDFVTLSLTAGEATESTLSFMIESTENADLVAYSCITEDQTVPDAAALFENGTTSEPGTKQHLIENLDANTSYIIVAAAKAGELTSRVKTIKMQTLKSTNVTFTPLKATSSVGSAYYAGIITNELTGQYHLYLSTFPFDDHGVPTGAGMLFCISLHADRAQDPNNASLPTGHYTLSNDYSAGTVDISWSSWRITDDKGQISEKGFFTYADVELENKNGQYHIVVRTTNEEDESFEVTYDGPVVWRNMIPGGEASYVTCFYYGEMDSNPGSDKWVLQLGDKHPNDVAATWLYQSEFFAPICADYKNPAIPDGTYTIRTGTEGYTLMPGERGATQQLYSGTFMDTISYGTWFFTEGSMTVTISGDQYTFSCIMNDDKGHYTDVHYSGTINIINRFTPKVQYDLDVTLDRSYAGKYYGLEYGFHNYMMCFADSELGEWHNPQYPGEGTANFLYLDFYSATEPTSAFDIQLPEGTYTIGDIEEDFVCISFNSYLYHWDEDGFRHYAELGSGTVTVTHTDDGYSIELQGEDESGKSLHYVYNGPVSIDNAAL